MESGGHNTKLLKSYKQNRPLKRQFSFSNCVKGKTIKPIKVLGTEQKLNKIYVNPNIADSCTQTSKTIIQLAKIEKHQISPDSLAGTPRIREETQKTLNKLHLDSNHIQKLGNDCTPEGEKGSSYLRKSNLNQYLEGSHITKTVPSQEEINAYPKTSLTETFLKKKQIEELSVTHNSRARFLQQTSPLRNLTKEFSNLTTESAKFKSQSYVEPHNYLCVNPEYVPLQASRFTVQNVKEQPIGEKPLPFQCYWSLLKQKKNEKDATSVESEDDQFDKSLKKSPSIRKRSSTFMSPTIASEQRSIAHNVQEIKHLIPPTKRGRSLSPRRAMSYKGSFQKLRVPYIDQSQTSIEENLSKPQKKKILAKGSNESNRFHPTRIAPLATRPKFDEDLLKIDLQSLYVHTSEDETVCPSRSESTSSSENMIWLSLNRVKHPDWNVALRGLAEMTELCRIIDPEILFAHMITVNQRMLELLRSPRSHVCRTACQAAGHFFESMKDTRRPEFDDIVEILLYKTADANKFIREDANLSLDCMVTHIPISHAIRTLCLKGPTHKNFLVRKATIRLIVCAVVIAGPSMVLTLPAHETSRKRVVLYLAKFLEDKNAETRKYAERLFKILSKEPTFELCLKKYLEKEDISKMKVVMKFKSKSV